MIKSLRFDHSIKAYIFSNKNNIGKCVL